MDVPHSQLGLAWVQLQGSANPCLKAESKAESPTLPSSPLQLQTFCIAIRSEALKESRISQAVYKLVLFSRFQKWGKVEAAGSLQQVEMEGK